MKIKLNNILLDSRIITKYLTDSRKSILLASTTILLTTVIILSTIISPSSVSAESFQSNELLQFTFNPTISINISSNLTIESLTPGDSRDSNVILVTASSNASAGYALTSTVGTSTNISNELRKGGTDTTNKFTNLAGNQPALTGFNDNEWGYSYSLCSTPECTNEPTWISGNTGSTLAGYDGYDYNTTTSTSETITHLTTTTSGSSAIKYKIGAKSSATQLAGEYTNAINFIGITNPDPPIIYMQDATLADCGKSMVDRRDHNVYSTTLIGDTCWMTKNLDLPGGTRLSSDDTDFESTYELPTTNGWTVENGKLVMPASSTEGFSQDNYAYVFNSGNQSTNCSTPGCYSYYSWDAATVGSGRSITTGNTDAPYSICPKGWHLPNTRTGTDETSDFRKLMVTLGGSSTIETYNANTTPTGAEMFNRLSGSPLHYLRTGYYYGGSFGYGGNYGFYWSATSSKSTNARSLYFNSTNVGAALGNYRRRGFGVRCLHD